MQPTDNKDHGIKALKIKRRCVYFILTLCQDRYRMRLVSGGALAWADCECTLPNVSSCSSNCLLAHN